MYRTARGSERDQYQLRFLRLIEFLTRLLPLAGLEIRLERAT